MARYFKAYSLARHETGVFVSEDDLLTIGANYLFEIFTLQEASTGQFVTGTQVPATVGSLLIYTDRHHTTMKFADCSTLGGGVAPVADGVLDFSQDGNSFIPLL